MRIFYEKPPKEVIPKSERPMSKQKYEEMFSCRFSDWYNMVYSVIKSCENEKCPIRFIISSKPKIKEAELKIIKSFPKMKIEIEKENDYKFA